MSLGERIKAILAQRKLTQVAFAAALGVSPNYVNQLVNGKKVNISDTLAKLIEETYGFSAQWVLTGDGDTGSTPTASAAKQVLLKKVQKMPEDEIAALLAFANSLDNVKKAFGIDAGK